MPGLSRPAKQPDNQRHHQEKQEQVEKNLRYAGRGPGDTAEAENAGNDRDDQENKSLVQHLSTPSLGTGVECAGRRLVPQ